jgi:hypothetical protein
MRYPELVNFSAKEEEMIGYALETLSMAFYDTELFEVLQRAQMPKRFRAMCLDTAGAVLGSEAFASEDMLVHVLEEELLHLLQKAAGKGLTVDRRTGFELEADVNDTRKFPCPDC